MPTPNISTKLCFALYSNLLSSCIMKKINNASLIQFNCFETKQKQVL